jgi:hypothetical protein
MTNTDPENQFYCLQLYTSFPKFTFFREHAPKLYAGYPSISAEPHIIVTYYVTYEFYY